jgi:hypothetical protein
MGGLLQVEMDAPATRDMSWAVSQTPSSGTTLPATITIPAGESSAVMDFLGVSSGSYSVTLTLLSSSNTATNTTLTVSGTNSSTSSVTAPRLWCELRGFMYNVGAGVWCAPKGGAAGHIIVRRSGFANFGTSPTQISVSTTDPSGILDTIDSSYSIPEGTAEVAIPVVLTSQVGDATVTLACGDWSESFSLRSMSQAVSLPVASIVLPANAKAYMPAYLAVRDNVTRTVAVTSGNTSVVAIDSTLGALEFLPGQQVAVTRLVPGSSGSTTLTFATSGLSSSYASVNVVGTEIAVSRTSITLSALSGSNPGEIAIRLPDGATWTSFSPPTGISYLSVRGIGSDTLRLQFPSGEWRPSTLTCECAVSSAPSGEFEVEVRDALHLRRLQYTLDVP